MMFGQDISGWMYGGMVAGTAMLYHEVDRGLSLSFFPSFFAVAALGLASAQSFPSILDHRPF